MNVIGDVAANYLTLLALLKKMPTDETILIGDFLDRGPRAKDLMEWLMKNGKALLGNHEHLCLDAYLNSLDPEMKSYKPYYKPGLWVENNGGDTTLKSYDPEFAKKLIHEIIPAQHIEYIKNLPLYQDLGQFFLSHAPKSPRSSPDECSKLGVGFHQSHKNHTEDRSLIWNRQRPRLWPGKIQIFGHLSFEEVRYYSQKYQAGIRRLPDDDVYAIAIDTSSANVLTGIHLPTMKIYQQEFID
jgi:hypothetical protein